MSGDRDLQNVLPRIELLEADFLLEHFPRTCRVILARDMNRNTSAAEQSENTLDERNAASGR